MLQNHEKYSEMYTKYSINAQLDSA